MKLQRLRSSRAVQSWRRRRLRRRLIERFARSGGGKELRLTPRHKRKLAQRVLENTLRIKSLSNWRDHLILIDNILSLPAELEGDVVECGCFNGASTANLSLACEISGRRLIACDSFEGLSEPTDVDRIDIPLISSSNRRYEKGEYSSDEGMAGVVRNVERFGCPDVCTFVPGYFEDTLQDLPAERLVMIFEDADLRSSVEDCVRHLWPRLHYGCRFYCHEPWSVPVVSLFYDYQWWKEVIGTNPPGFFGSGRGIAHTKSLGFAMKRDEARILERQSRLRVHFDQEATGYWRASLGTSDESGSETSQ